MLVTIIKKAVLALISVWIITILIFLLSKAIPGDPVDVRLDREFDSPSAINYDVEYNRLKKSLYLDRPVFYFSILPSNFPDNLNASGSKADIIKKRKELLAERKWLLPTVRWHGLNNQYHIWLSQPGRSILDGRPAGEKIRRALVWTVFLVFTSIFLSYSLGVLIGLGLSSLRNDRLRTWIEGILFGIYAIPVFWMATLLLVFFTTKEYGAWTNIFPSVGLAPIDMGEPWYSRIAKYGSQLILPCLVLVLHNLAFLSTLTKRNIDKGKKMGFVTTSKAYGFSEKEILFKEVLPFSLIPLITAISTSIPSAIGGSLVIEIIFNIPGMGRLLYQAILNYDWAVVFPIVVLIAVFTYVSFLLADVFYRIADPRIR